MNPSSLMRDVRYAVRMLLRNPGFTIIALLTFAVGIGVNTAVFSVFNAVLLRPLPYPDADRITMMWVDNRPQNIKEDIGSYPNYLDWRQQSTSYEHVAAYTGGAFTLTGSDEPERVPGARTTAHFHDVMGLKPVLGRLYTEEHEKAGNDSVVLLSYGLWQRKFGGTNDVIGKTLVLNGVAHEIIGVMPPELRVPSTAQLWTPLAPNDEQRTARGWFWLPVIGRLKAGVSVEQAQTEMSGIAARIEKAYPEAMAGFGAHIVPLHKQIVGDVERSLLVLMAAVGCVLLIACANLGNLMLGRTAARRKELAIRTALGARRSRVVRQIVTEALVLALAGSVLGLLLAFWATEFFISVGGDAIPRATDIGIDGPVLLFTLALAVASALLAGLVPAIQASRTAVREHLQEGGREASGGSHRTRSALIAAEMALAFVLLAGAGILVRTLWSMQHLDRGFDPRGVAVMTLSLPPTLFAGPDDVRGFYTRLLERIRTLPGVESAATTTGVLQPLVTNSGILSIEGKPDPPRGQQIEYPVEIVSPGFFETLRIPLAAGRTFTEQDHADAPLAVVVNETFARMAWPGQDPIGRRIKPGTSASQNPWMTVAGVIKDVRRNDVTRALRPEIYRSGLQVTPRTQMIIVRVASGDPVQILPSIRREVRAMNPQLPLFATGTLEGELSETLSQPRFRAVLLAGFAVIAMLLASIGIYGVTAHAVSQRTQEVGVRMALGAQRGDVLVLVLQQHLKPALAGVVLGLVGAFGLARYIQSMVYGVAATDPVTLITMGVSLLVVAVAACWIPARRATRVDAIVALRNQ